MSFKVAISALVAIVFGVLAACGGGDDEPATTAADAAPCSDVQTVEVPKTGEHSSKKFTVEDYETIPPAGGDHNPDPLETGKFYEDAELGMAVHALEHGAVIGWTNDLSQDERKQLEKTFNELYSSGYRSLATVELPELDGPFALSAWGAVQKCQEFDPSVIEPFVDKYYGTNESAEGFLACLDEATKTPACAGSKK